MKELRIVPSCTGYVVQEKTRTIIGRKGVAIEYPYQCRYTTIKEAQRRVEQEREIDRNGTL